jgi:prevent-host-death family protein
MKQIQASVAKARFAELLDEVERGETVVITRHGKEIATLSPRGAQRRLEIEEAFAAMDAIRARNKPVTLAEILAWRDEGRP